MNNLKINCVLKTQKAFLNIFSLVVRVFYLILKYSFQMLEIKKFFFKLVILKI